VADWTTIVTAIGASTVAGVTGYASARYSGKVAMRQIEAENERLREQHREDHLRNRQGTYHEFIQADLAMSIALQSEDVPVDFLPASSASSTATSLWS